MAEGVMAAKRVRLIKRECPLCLEATDHLKKKHNLTTWEERKTALHEGDLRENARSPCTLILQRGWERGQTLIAESLVRR